MKLPDLQNRTTRNNSQLSNKKTHEQTLFQKSSIGNQSILVFNSNDQDDEVRINDSREGKQQDIKRKNPGG